jgi:aryl-alcohol dehydrogenase-like predicted oxidoreductase
VPLSTNQIQFSLLARGADNNGLLKTAKELDVKILAYSPLAQGILTGKFTKENLPKVSRI